MAFADPAAAAKAPAASAPPASGSVPANVADTARATEELTALAGELRVHPDRRRALSSRITAVASARQRALLRLIDSDPQDVPGVLLDADAAAVLHGVDAADVETRTRVGGDLEVVTGTGGTKRYLVPARGSALSLSSNGTLPDVSEPGVSTSGYLIGQTIFIAAAGGSAAAPLTTTSTTAPSTGMVGTVDAAVIVTYFSDTTNPFSMTNISATFGGHPGADVESYFSEVSYEQTALVPSFYGPYQLAMTQEAGCANVGSLAQASLAASGGSATYANVQRFVYVVDCPNLGSWAGVGTYGVVTPQGTVQASESWISVGSETSTYGYIHELGHNAGFQHADWAVCAPDAFDPPTNFGPNCPTAPYGDSFDTMGTAPFEWSQTPHYDAYHKYLAGWLSPATFPTVSAPGTYTYTLAPLESSSAGAIALDIPRGDSGTSFTVEYRQPLGFDSWLSTCGSTCNVTQGASIKLVGGLASGADVHALDMTPNSQPSSGYWDERDYYKDEALLPGMTFTDPEYGIQVTTLSAGPSGLSVKVTVPTQACTHTPPSVSVSPASTSVAPGQTATWSVTVTNRYSAGCPPARFRFRSYGTHRSNPYTDPGVFTLAPGASTTLTMSLPVSATLPYGTYTDQASIQASALADPGTSFAYGFTVAGAADTSPPTPPQHLGATANGARLVTLTWLPGSDGVAVGAYEVYRNDALLTTSGPVSATTFLDAAASPSTAYTYRVVAVNWGGVASAYSNAASVITPGVTDTAPPADVPGFTATAVADHDVHLSWRPATDDAGIAYYTVVHDSLRTLYPATTTSLDVGDLWSSVPTALYVLADDADGNSSNLSDAMNGELAVTTAASGTTAPLAPATPIATAITPSTVTLAWPAVPGASGYTISRNLIRIATVSAAGYTDSQVPAGGCEIYTIAATDASGNVSAASPQSVIYVAPSTAGATPPAPSITAPAGGSILSGTVGVTTSASDPSGIGSVQLVVDGVPQGSLTAAPFNFTLDTTTLSNGAHTLVVLATAKDGDAGSSSTVSVSVSNPDTTPPSAPASLRATPAAAPVVDLAWAASTDNVGVVGYDVYRNGTPVATTVMTAFADTGLSAATAYTYQVRARDAAGNVSAFSPSASAMTEPADTQPPSAPAGLSATAMSATQATLSWAASTDNVAVTGYGVYRSAAGSTYMLAGTPTGTTFTDSGLASGTPYTYYVQAFDSAGNVSTASNVVTATPQTPPMPPTNLAAAATSSSQVALSWAASFGGATVGYDVYRSVAGSAFTQVATIAGSTTSYTDGGLAAATAYMYYVTAYNASGAASSPSNQAGATTPAASLTAPGSLTASASSTSQVSVGWGASSGGAGITGYHVYRSTGGSAFTVVASVSAPATSYIDTSLAAATTYTYYVVSYDSAGDTSPASNQASATTQAATGTLGGTVSGSGTGPISGATVTISAGGSTRTTTTNASGAYTLGSLPAGTWPITVSARHYATTTVTVTITAGVATTENVVLPKSH